MVSQPSLRHNLLVPSIFKYVPAPLIDLVPLTQQLEAFGVVGMPLKWIKSYMSERSQSVVWCKICNAQCSSKFNRNQKPM